MKRLCTIGGIELRCHWTVVPGLVLWLLLGEPLELLGAGAALLLHEWSHALTARGLGARVEGMELYPFGACVQVEEGGSSREELLIAIAGPLCGTVAAGVTLLMMELFPGAAGVLSPFFRYNLGLSLLNLLPGYPLDGGRSLACLLRKRLSSTEAIRVTAWVGMGLGVSLLALGVWGILRQRGNVTILLFAFFLFAAAGRELVSLPESRLLDTLRRGKALKNGRPVDVYEVAVGAACKVREAVGMVRQGQYTLLLVVDGKGRLLGTVDEGRLMDAATRLGQQATLGEVVRKERNPKSIQ